MVSNVKKDPVLQMLYNLPIMMVKLDFEDASIEYLTHPRLKAFLSGMTGGINPMTDHWAN